MVALDAELQAIEGDVEAQCVVAFLYEMGIDRPQDYRKAAHFWQLAAKSGRQMAIDKLQNLIEKGKVQAAWLGDDLMPLDGKSNKALSQSLPTGQWLGKILIVDIDPQFRSSTVKTLEAAGYQTVQAKSGEEAVQVVIANPDLKLITTGLKLAKMNGLKFVQTMRRMRLAESARIIVITMYAQPKLIAMGKQLSVDAWLIKPVTDETLIKTVSTALSRGKSKPA